MTAPQPRWDLSGSGQLEFEVAPDTGHLQASDGLPLFKKRGTLIHEETDGRITWSGIVTDPRPDGETFKVTCKGVSTYAYGMPYLGEYSGVQVDPAAVFRHMWAHMQGFTDGDLSLAVTGSTKVRIGQKKKEVSFKTGDGEDVNFDAGPHELNWWEAPDIGREMDSLAEATPFDWVEHHAWNADKTDVVHEIRIGYPRVGRHRTDLVFQAGVNVKEWDAPDYGDYANTVVGIGSGEGKKAVRRTTSVRDGSLRTVLVESDKSVTTNRLMDAKIRNRLNASLDALRIPKIVVEQHPNARIGSWSVGDDITLQLDLPWLGKVALKSRIVSWKLLTDDRAELSLERSDSFIYGG
ncbi:hypothetical protein [Paramicrobacterium chengjingii]|uniref:hypothetical protein n=1 Tax=Paramicrobacterium chengjingii TaxID=2769067 RepID=UPI0014247B7C|nr:hypothetical protein [Microbacterium chengjingii]